MSYFIAIQNNYHIIEIAFWNEGKLIDQVDLSKNDASRRTIILLEQLLNNNNCSLHNLSFIAINQGPGPSTTLRVIMALMNGLSFATGISLIGIDGLSTLLNEHKSTQYPYTIALLNACNQDVYFAIFETCTDHFVIKNGYKNIHTLLNDIQQIIPNTPIRFLGNGTKLHKKIITNVFGINAQTSPLLPETCSIRAVGSNGWAQWQKKSGLSKKVVPLYVKTYRTVSKNNL